MRESRVTRSELRGIARIAVIARIAKIERDPGVSPSRQVRISVLTQNQRVAGTRAAAMEAKILAPSADPSSFSLDRSGCGIIPSTFLPSLQIPAMFSSDRLGLASRVIWPSGVQ